MMANPRQSAAAVKILSGQTKILPAITAVKAAGVTTARPLGILA
jgi:hypothetical protein